MNPIDFRPISASPNLVSESVFASYNLLTGDQKPQVAEIDPQYMGGKELCEHYGISPDEGANCVIVEAVKSETSEYVAIVVPVDYRANLNGIARKHLGARRVSLAPLDKVLEITGMEYGSITPFGLPDNWKKLIDARLLQKENIVVGGGKQISKLLLPTSVLRELPNVEAVENLSQLISA